MKEKLYKLTKETTIYGTSIVVGRFLNFLLTPLYTNYLTENQVAFITYIYAIIAFVNIAYSFGMESAFFRFIKSDETNLSANQTIAHEKKIFSNSYFSILIFSVINSLLIYIFAAEISGTMSEYSVQSGMIKLIAFIPVMDALILIPFAYLRSTRQAMKFSILRFIAIVINVIANFFFLTTTKLGVWGVIYANIISSSIALMIFIPMIFKHLILKIDFTLIRKMFAFGLPTVPASLSAIILQVADRPLMKMLATTKDQAIYGVNYRLGIPMMMFVSVFEYAWKPFYLSHYKDSDAKELFSKVLTYFTLISVLLIILWTFSIDFAVRLPFIGGKMINPSYWIGLPIVPIVLWGYYFNGVFTNFNAGFLIQKKTMYLPLVVGISAIINILINYFVIPEFSYYGAAWATFFAYLAEAVLIYYYAAKIYPIRYEWSKIIKILFSGISIVIIERYFYSLNFSLLHLFLIRIGLFIVFLYLLSLTGIIKNLELGFIRKFIKK